MKSRVLWVIVLQMMLGSGLLLTGACTPPVQPHYPPPDTNRDTDRDNNRRRVRDRDNNKEREITRRRKTGECADDKKCQDICDDIFRARKHRSECEEFSYNDVEKMEAVFEILEDPDTDDLEDLELKDLEFLLDISSDPLKKAVDKMSPSEQKDFLAWLASDSEAADIVADAEDEFEILKELFGSSESNIVSTMNKSIDSGDTFIEVALEEGNDVALEWLHDFFGDQCENKDKYEKCIFKKFYCEMSLSGDFDEEYFDFEFFEDMLDEILENERKSTGAPAWWEADTEAGDLDAWQSSPHNVCTSMNEPNDFDD